MKSRIKTKEVVYRQGYKITKKGRGFLVNTAWGNFKYYYPGDKNYPRILTEYWEGDFFRA